MNFKNTMNLQVDVLVNIIIQTYLNNSRCLIIFTDNNNYFNYSGGIPTIRVTLIKNNIPSNVIFNYFGCQDFIIKTNHPLSVLVDLERKIRFSMERFNNRKYLFIPGDEMQENFSDISKLNEMNYISDVLLVMLPKNKTKSQVVYLKTHKYVGQKDNNKLVLIDKWFTNNHTFLRNYSLFRDKLYNQEGRPLKMATFQYEPYSIIGSTAEDHRGSEMFTAVMFAKLHNMTPIAVVNENDYWGEIFTNWSGNGLLGNIANDKADIGFSALYTWEVDYHFLDLSKPLVRTGITCLVPTPKLAAGWLTPLFSYSYAMWTVVVALYLTCILSLFFINTCNLKTETMLNRYHKRTRNTDGTLPLIFTGAIFTISRLLILQNLTKSEMPHGPIGKYFMGLVFMLSLFLTSTYSSGLSSIMTIPRYNNPINTVEEFVRSGIQWGATQEAWITSIEHAEEPDYISIVDRFVATSEESLREFSLNGDFGFSLERLPKDNYAIGSYIREDVISNYHLMQQDFYWEQCVIMTKKSSILLPSLDIFILKVFEAGLISVWQNEAVTLYMDPNVQKVVKYYTHHGQEKIVVKLKWTHVEGAFAVLLFGYAISFAAFVFEIFRKKHHKIQYQN